MRGMACSLCSVNLAFATSSQVHHVRHKATKRDLAAKIMDKVFIKKERKIAEVMMEKRVLSTTRSPHVVRLHYSFQVSFGARGCHEFCFCGTSRAAQDEQYLYMVMELCQGGDLLSMIRCFKDAKQSVPGPVCDDSIVRCGTDHFRFRLLTS